VGRVGSRLILHVTDIHCGNRALAAILEEAPSVDVVAATGDFQCLDTVEELLSKAPAPLVAVTGNMDDVSIGRRLREAGALVEGRYTSVAGLHFGGVGGLDPAASLELLASKPRPEGDLVLLTHHPPKGVVDRSFIGVHAGLRELRELDERLRPRAHLCGHIHEARGTGRVGETIVVNAGPARRGYYALVEVGDEVRVELRRARP
jgi:Icc-related predicted phosphoesterase